MLPDAILFDFNGVIVDDERIHGALFRESLAELGIALDDASYSERFIGLNDRAAFRVALVEAGRGAEAADAARIEALVGAKSRRYTEGAGAAAPLFPGARELLERLRGQAPLAIVSGARRREIAYVLERHDLAGIFDAIVSGDDVGRSKPDPEGYLLGMERLAAARRRGPFEAARCLAIEDSLAGVRAARAAGLPCFAVAHTFPPASLAAALPAACFDDLAALALRLASPGA